MITSLMAVSAKSQSNNRIRVGVLVYSGCSAWVATGIREAFTLANLLQDPYAGGKKSTIEARWVSPVPGQVAASAGVVIDTAGRSSAPPDVLVVPPLWHTSASDFKRRLKTLDKEIALVEEMAGRGVTVASVCSGVALPALAGLLDGRAATGCWWLEQPLRTLFPRIKWQFNDRLVRDGPVVTAGSGTAYADLVFELLEQATGRSLAMRTARLLGFEPSRHRQSSFAQVAPLGSSDDPLVVRFERHVWRNLAGDALDIGKIAIALDTSVRTLHRRVNTVTGDTPLRFIQRARLEHAKALLAETTLSVEEICTRCGWSDVSSFRKLFTREVGLTASAWRKGFTTRRPVENDSAR